MTTTPAPAPASPPVRRKPLLVVLLLPVFMTLVAVSVINVALAAIGEGLQAGSVGLQWVLSGYALAFGMVLVPAGRLGDATGRRRLMLIGVSLFTLGSLAAGLAPDIQTLNAARVMQGVGSGLVNPQTVGIIQQHFRGQDRARAFAFLGTTVAVATATGPVLGGLLIQLLGTEVGWRWIFYLNVPVGALTLLGLLRWVPDDRRRESRRADLDPIGTVLLTAAIAGIMLPFLERGASSLIWLTLPAGLLLAGMWWGWEDRYRARGRAPMVDTAIFSNRAFRNGIAIIGVYFLGSTSVWIVVPLYLQLHLEHTAFQVALVGLPSSVLAAVSSQLGGRFILRFGRRLVIGGFAIAATAVISTALLSLAVESGAVPYWTLTSTLCLVGLSQGLIITPNQTLTLNAVDPRYGGVAGGILQLGQRLGAAIGTAMIPGILFTLTEGGADWSEAFIIVMAIIASMTIGAIGLCVIDRRREKAESAVAA